MFTFWFRERTHMMNMYITLGNPTVNTYQTHFADYANTAIGCNTSPACFRIALVSIDGNGP